MKKLLTFLLTALLAFGVGWAETVTDFQETFNTNSGTGGNDDAWSGSIATSNASFDNSGWTLANGNGASACIKLGTSSKKGSAETPSISVISGTQYTLTFKAGAWNSSKENTTLNLSATGGTLSNSSVTMIKGAWTSYSITFTATGTTAKIKFEASATNNARFFLDEVVLTHEGGSSPSLTTATVSFPDDSYTATLGQGFTAPTLTVTPAAAASEVSYTSSDTNVATVNPTTGAVTLVGAGTTTITAAITGSSTYTAASDSYELTVSSGSTPSGKTYQKITSTSDLTDGNYLIVYETGSVAFDGSLTALDNANNNTAVIIETSGSTKTITTSDDIYFTYNSSKGTLKSASGYYIGQNSYGNGLASSTSDQYVNQISFNSGNAIIEGAGQSGGSHVALKYNKASDNLRFRYYKSGQENIQLYKDVTPTTPKVATPTFSPDASVAYTSAQTVTISCATEGATIHYTYNGGPEQTGTSPITLNVNSTATIVAWATLDDYEDSEQVTATYTINLTPTLTADPNPLNINDDNTSGGRTGSFTVEGANLPSNVGVDVMFGNFSRTTTGG